MDIEHFRSHYDEHGYVRLAGGFPSAAAAAMADAIWAALTRREGIAPADSATWTVVVPRGFAALREHGVFDPLGTAAVVDAITTLLRTDGWHRPRHWGAALVTFPTPGEWSVPSSGWHIDWPARGAPGSQLLIKWLGFATPVVAGGGGTVILAGSHRLVADVLTRLEPDDPGPSRAVRDAVFAGDPSLDLPALMDGATVGGVPVRVVELTGGPGDVVFLHPHVLHAAAPNHRSRPRFMIAGQVVRMGV